MVLLEIRSQQELGSFIRGGSTSWSVRNWSDAPSAKIAGKTYGDSTLQETLST
jgi:hypothetical protein